METTILLVRHGQTKSNVFGFYMGRSDEDLDETGYAQARRLASRLASQPITAVYTSPLKRAHTTAAIIAEPHDLELTTLDGANEIDLGDWQGLHMDEIKRRWPELWRQSRVDPSDVTMPNGESFKQLTERVVRAFETIINADQGKQVVAVTHDAIIRVLVTHILGVTNSIYRRIQIDNASISAIQITDARVRLILLNDISHHEA